MSTIRKTTTAVGVGVFALGLSLLGATAAHAEGTYQVIDECGFQNDQVIVTGDYRVGYSGHYDSGYNVKDDWGVSMPNPDYSVPDNPIPSIMVASGTFDHTPCPPPEPEPSETPQEVVAPPAGQTTTQSPTKTTTQTDTAPEVTVEPTPEESAEAPAEVTIEASDEPEVQATTETSEPGVPVGIVIGGLGALAAVGGGAFYAGKRGWFAR